MALVKGTIDESAAKKEVASLHEKWMKEGTKTRLEELCGTLDAIKSSIKEFAKSQEKIRS